MIGTNRRHGIVPQPVSAWALLHRSERPSWPLFAPSSTTTMDDSSCRRHEQQQVPITLASGISELAGPAGSGKTQLALHLCLQCAATPIPSSRQQQTQKDDLQHQQPEYFHAIYISMGPSSSLAQSKLAGRLEQMALAQYHNHQIVRALLSRIWLRMVHNIDEFHELMDHDLPRKFFCPDNPLKVGVLVLDSLANLVRSPQDFPSSASSTQAPSTGFNNCWIQQRTALFFELASQLKRWAHEYQLTVLVVNQVTQSISDNSNNNNWSHNSKIHEQQPQPALGLSWSTCINSSIWLTRRERQTAPHSEETAETRVLKVLSKDGGHDKRHVDISLHRRVTPDGPNLFLHKPTQIITSPWRRIIGVRFSPCLPSWSGPFTITTAGPILLDESN